MHFIVSTTNFVICVSISEETQVVYEIDLNYKKRKK